VNSARHGELRLPQQAGQDCEPPQPQQDLARVREPHLGDDFEILDVDVRLEEAVEEDQCIGSRTISTVSSSISAPLTRSFTGTSKMFSSSASAPTSSIARP
jgi:hypothetical protein